MKGITKIILNQKTIEAAVQTYFLQCFDASQLATVTAIEPTSSYDSASQRDVWVYTVTFESEEKAHE